MSYHKTRQQSHCRIPAKILKSHRGKWCPHCTMFLKFNKIILVFDCYFVCYFEIACSMVILLYLLKYLISLNESWTRNFNKIHNLNCMIFIFFFFLVYIPKRWGKILDHKIIDCQFSNQNINLQTALSLIRLNMEYGETLAATRQKRLIFGKWDEISQEHMNRTIEKFRSR